MTSLPIVFPTGFSPVVNIEDTVTVGQLLAQKIGKEEEVINIAQVLSIPLTKVKNVLKKNPGDAVAIGDVIAVKKGFLGFGGQTIMSKVAGTVSRYERHTGNLAIRTSYNALTQKLVSPVDGIIALCNNKKIVISTDKNVIVGLDGGGETGQGEVYILEDSFSAKNQESLLYSLGSQAIGKIVVGKIFTREMLTKASGIGALGVVAEEVTKEDIDYLAQKKLQTPVVRVDSQAIEKLQAWEGKSIYLDGQAKSLIFLHL